jgi:hypothetical protein
VHNVYEIDSGRGIYWEVWKDAVGQAWQDEYVCTIETKTELNEYLHNLSEEDADYIVHALEESDAVV